MHLYVMAKGIKPHLETWQNELLAQKLPLMRDGKPVIEEGNRQMFVQLAVRPVQLFEIGFPKEHLDYVMNVVGTGDYILDRYPILNYSAKALRKSFGLKDVPIPKAPNMLMQPEPTQKSVAIVPIGIKEDMFSKDGVEQL